MTDRPKWAICPECEGDGSHAKHLGVINREDWDEEEFEDYMAGYYDRPCACCNGTGKVRGDTDHVADYYSREKDRKEAYRLACAEDGRPFDWY